MRYLSALLMMTSFISSARGATFVYVSKSPEQQIQVYRLNPDDGSLAPTATVAVDGTPGCLTVDAERQYLFASLRSTTSLASFRIDPNTGGLTLLSRTQLPMGENAAFVRSDATGKWLLSASYAAGKVVVHSLTDGVIGERPVQTVETVKTAHCIAIDRGNSWVFVPHVAPNAVFQFRFDAATGQLTDAGRAPGGAEGAGPRHLAWHPTANEAYTSNETGNSITTYYFDPETGLKPMRTVSTLPLRYSGKNTTAEVKVHPRGDHVWVSNRGHDSLSGFRIDPCEDGIYSSGGIFPEGASTAEATPRSFDIDPSGKFVFVAGEGSGKLGVFSVSLITGGLERLHTYDVGKSLSWVLAVELNAP